MEWISFEAARDLWVPLVIGAATVAVAYSALRTSRDAKRIAERAESDGERRHQRERADLDRDRLDDAVAAVVLAVGDRRRDLQAFLGPRVFIDAADVVHEREKHFPLQVPAPDDLVLKVEVAMMAARSAKDREVMDVVRQAVNALTRMRETSLEVMQQITRLSHLPGILRAWRNGSVSRAEVIEQMTDRFKIGANDSEA